MRRFLGVLSLLLMLPSCSGKSESETQAAADTLTRRQRDSILANSKIPGAGAVGRAMGAADRANARYGTQDSIARQPR